MSIVNYKKEFEDLTKNIRNGKKYQKTPKYKKRFMKLKKLWKQGKIDASNIDKYTQSKRTYNKIL